MKFEIMSVTPEMAAKWLGKNEGNRKLREHRAAYLARAIDEGKFKLTHQAIAITRKGRLIDGQHRLRAIILANTAAPLVVATDVPDDTFAVLDAGLPRTMAERLRSDKKETGICTSMFRLLVGRSNAHEYEIEVMLDVFGGALRALDAVPPSRSSRKFEKYAFLAAFVLRLAIAQRKGDEKDVARLSTILERLRRADMTGAAPVVLSLYRQFNEGVANSDIAVAPATDQFCRGWVALDARNAQSSKLLIRDHSASIREARVEFKAITQSVFD
jgi:hypothetical protein